MALNCVVRHAEFEDASVMLDIFRQCDPHSTLANRHNDINLLDVMDWLETITDRHPIFMAEQDQQVIGWCSLEAFYGLPSFDQACEISLYVLPSLQGQGVGKALLEHVIQHRQEIGFLHLVAYIYAGNDNSLRFFKANEFQTWGKLPNIARSEERVEDVYLLGREFELLDDSSVMEEEFT
ncbi:GNAT family N-acetyltransferase [Marinomonas sp. TW1]|uniref:GNAT family N-acetyltransferase n=1 Tax=Marinomonas sp. TW1 TaxID=1561203 RepID=UPI0007AF00FF|nr:GNAT family N-acetyltransferase [Marinomonas sp. TW1]KZN14684.1 GCN5 family acetyltransferase [Marinomonas sp. TW1]